MKKAFTMIELIFVIVIIGILAAVAIPKLAATRDDALISTIVSNAKVAYNDITAFYLSQGNSLWNSSSIRAATNSLLFTSCNTLVDDNTSLSPNTFVLCHDEVICLSFQTTTEGNFIVADGVDATDSICEAVKSDYAITAISNKTYVLGGETIVR